MEVNLKLLTMCRFADPGPGAVEEKRKQKKEELREAAEAMADLEARKLLGKSASTKTTIQAMLT